MGVDQQDFTFFIEKEAGNKEQSADKFFTLWFVEQKYGPKNQGFHYTEGQDGGVDYIIEKEDELIIIQTKFSKISTDALDRFLKAINAFENKKERDFEEWLNTDVQQENNRHIFREAYRKYKNKAKLFELVVLQERNEKTIDKLSKPKRNISFVGIEILLYLYMLHLIGIRESPTITIETDRSSLDFEDAMSEYATRVFMIKLKPFLQFLINNPESELIFGRNVRVYHGETPVNEEMKDTWINDPSLFFYGNNGIHIICNKCEGGTGKWTLTNPQIINGSQTLHSIKESGPPKDGWILARVTIIPERKQIDRETQDMINKIILYSNSNNAMSDMDLRSNDEIQVKLAKLLYSRNFFYERKTNEWKLEKDKHPQIIGSICSKDLAMIMMVCDKRYGPVHYKKIGSAPLFRSPQNNHETKSAYYPEQFEHAVKSIDETETKIRLNLFIKKILKYIKTTKDTKRIPGASCNFILSIFWKAIQSSGGLEYPIKIPIKQIRNQTTNFNKLKRPIVNFGDEIVKYYKLKSKRDGINVNDFFRNENIYRELGNKFRNGDYSDIFLKAINEL